MTTDRIRTHLNAELVEKIDAAAASHRLNREDYIELILSQQLGILEVDETLAWKLSKAYEDRYLATSRQKRRADSAIFSKRKWKKRLRASLSLMRSSKSIRNGVGWLGSWVGNLYLLPLKV